MPDNELRAALVTGETAVHETTRRAIAATHTMRLALEIDSPIGGLDRDAVDRLRDAGPDLVLIDFADDPDLAVRFARHLEGMDPGLYLIGIGPSLSQEQLLTAMRSGLGEYLPTPVEPDGLAAALERAARKLGSDESAGSPGGPGTVLTFVGANGGTGCTTVAANVAVALARLTGDRIVLVDLDLMLGDAAVRLGLDPKFDIGDAAGNVERLDAQLLASFLTEHEAGIDVLAAPADPESARAIRPEHTRRMLTLLRRTHRHVIVDAAKAGTAVSAAAAADADALHYVTVPELPALRNLKMRIKWRAADEHIDGAGALGSESARRAPAVPEPRMIVNRYEPYGLVTAGDIRDALSLDVYGTLPDDATACRRAANTGQALVLAGDGELVSAIERLAARVAGVDAALPPDRNWLARVLQRFGWRSRPGSAATGGRP